MEISKCCSFCGKNITDVELLIQGKKHLLRTKDVFICEHCILACFEVVEKYKHSVFNKILDKVRTEAFNEFWAGI